jgi:MFS family permease
MAISDNEAAPPETRAATRPTSLWRNRDYLLLWGSQAVSSAGSSASSLALPLLILALTHSPAQAGFAGALRSLAYMVLGLPAGVLIDRWNRKLTMIVCDAGRALALGSIPLAAALGHLSMTQVYVVSLLEGALFVFFSLEEGAVLPGLVATTQLPAATARDSVTDGVVTLVGPSLGGALFGVGRVLPFAVDAISYAASMLALCWLRVPARARFTAGSSQVPSRESRARRWWREMPTGLVWLWRQPVLRAFALLHSGLVLATSGLTLLLLVVAQQRHTTPFAIGLMLSIGGVGGLLGGLVGAQAHKRLRLGQIMVGAFWAMALLLPLFALMPSPLALGALLALFWVADETYDVAQVSYRLAVIPNALWGRVTGAMRPLFFACDSLGLALMGLLLQRAGVLATIICVCAGMLLLAVVATLNRDMRTARPLADL